MPTKTAAGLVSRARRVANQVIDDRLCPKTGFLVVHDYEAAWNIVPDLKLDAIPGLRRLVCGA